MSNLFTKSRSKMSVKRNEKWSQVPSRAWMRKSMSAATSVAPALEGSFADFFETEAAASSICLTVDRMWVLAECLSTRSSRYRSSESCLSDNWAMESVSLRFRVFLALTVCFWTDWQVSPCPLVPFSISAVQLQTRKKVVWNFIKPGYRTVSRNPLKDPSFWNSCSTLLNPCTSSTAYIISWANRSSRLK